MTLKCDLSTTPCEHLFHTICIKNISQNLLIPAGHGYLDMAQNSLILTLLARKMVCYYCGNLNIQLFKISFKTADEINNFAKRMKKIDQNASYSSNENEEVENNFQNLSLENFSKDFYLRSPEIVLINRPWPWINGQTQPRHDQAFKVQEVYGHDDFESIDSKENFKTFEEDILNMKVLDDVAQSPNGTKFEVNMSLNSGFVEMKSYAHATKQTTLMQATPQKAQATPQQAQATPKPTKVRHDMPKHAKPRQNLKELEKEDHQMKFNKRKPKRQPS